MHDAQTWVETDRCQISASSALCVKFDVTYIRQSIIGPLTVLLVSTSIVASHAVSEKSLKPQRKPRFAWTGKHYAKLKRNTVEFFVGGHCSYSLEIFFRVQVDGEDCGMCDLERCSCMERNSTYWTLDVYANLRKKSDQNENCGSIVITNSMSTYPSKTNSLRSVLIVSE
jgi:hypothetical protein